MTTPCLSAADSVLPKSPLRNGDFSLSLGWGRPADWDIHTESGTHTFATDPASDPGLHSPRQAIITTETAGRAAYLQTLTLPAGTYRFQVEIAGSAGLGATVLLQGTETAAEKKDVSEQWQTVAVELSTTGGPLTAGLFAEGTAPGTVRFRQAQLDIVRLVSSPVPLAGGEQIGGIVLPDNPTEGERHAAFELQNTVFRMTGQVPGLKGRDEVFPGLLVHLGRPEGDGAAKFDGLVEGSFLAGRDGEKIVLGGLTDLSTLYAVYDFLERQGCRWIMPGAVGEVIPQRKELTSDPLRVESPDYLIRGFFTQTPDFLPPDGKGWILINVDEYFDWAVRNRFNAVILDGEGSVDLGAQRGHGWQQVSGHTWGSKIAPHQEYFAQHPEWYALVGGKRTPVNKTLGYPNQLCVSNAALRDYTEKVVLDYFEKNPHSRGYALNPMDNTDWCECEECKALDPEGIDWSINGTAAVLQGVLMQGMTDRSLNFANDIARRIAAKYPDKFIEMYAYGQTRQAPQREKPGPNVRIHYAQVSGPINKDLLTDNHPAWLKFRQPLEKWKAQGAERFTFYYYADWENPNVAFFRYHNIVDHLRTLHREFGADGLWGETQTTVQGSPMFYQIMSRTAWDLETNTHDVIQDVCRTFYGPAAEVMERYYRLMDGDVMKSTAPLAMHSSALNEHRDVSLSALAEGGQLLEEAAKLVESDETLTRRIAYARFSHACLSYLRAGNESVRTKETVTFARGAFKLANKLRREFALPVKMQTVPFLDSFRCLPTLDPKSVVFEFPVEWKFKTDGRDEGVSKKWFGQAPDASWKPLRTDQDWRSQGELFYGAAWYQTDFRLPESAKDKRLALHFGAVDGYVDVYLDGVKIGEQKQDVSLMWDKPFDISLPAHLADGKDHRLFVRVQKESAAAGITKGAAVVIREK